MFGFDIPENFNKPYQASSISDFWRRWHISLSRWFRDYIYIPMGGNRCSIPRHIFNMLVVWAVTGIWHGADWSFILWGLGYFVLLIIEKYAPFMKNIGKHWYDHIYALFFVNLLWIPFRANSLSTAGKYISGMFGANGLGVIEEKALAFIPFVLVASIILFPWNKLFDKFSSKLWFKIIKGIVVLALFGLAMSAVVNSSYSPYIYGNF